MHPNVTTLLAVLQAFNENDIPAVAEHVAPDVSYTIPGRARISGEFHGVEEVAAAFARLRELSGGTISVAPQAVLADDEHVMFKARVTASRDGHTLDVTNAYVWRFAGGKLAEGQIFPGDQHAIEAFFS